MNLWLLQFSLVAGALFLHSIAANTYLLFPAHIAALGGDVAGRFEYVMIASVIFAISGCIAVLPLREMQFTSDGTKGGGLARFGAVTLRPIWIMTASFAMAISTVFTLAEPFFRNDPNVSV